MKRIKDIEDHLERADVLYDRFLKIEAIKERSRRRERVFKVEVDVASIICALYAVYLQF